MFLKQTNTKVVSCVKIQKKIKYANPGSNKVVYWACESEEKDSKF